MIMDGVIDTFVKMRSATTDEEKAAFAKDVLPVWLGYFERLLKKHHDGKAFFLGDKISYCDLAVFNLTDNLKMINEKSLDGVPLLKEFHHRIATRPKIAEWLKKRPVTKI